ncbi:MAG: isoprenylcysteine carboxylmethyltransferase family protein [Chloroflexi bacterium]|nr:isoprenylcysteine carboxylmethyltransferase family protein [Chloroflexota bacterium]
MWQLAVFFIASVFIFWFSRASLRDWRLHGFFRFFAFESVLALILLNVEMWFDDPFSPLHLLAWLILIASLFLIVHGVYLLRVIGKPQGNIEQTTTLVQIGAYKFIRHPLYASLLYLAWGAFLKQISLASVVLVLAASLFLFATARVEEDENVTKFGRAYVEYMQSTKRFVPFVF